MQVLTKNVYLKNKSQQLMSGLSQLGHEITSIEREA